MNRKANFLPVVRLFSTALTLFVAVGCGQADVEQAAARDETNQETALTTTGVTDAETTSRQEKSAVVRVGDGTAVAKAGGVEASAGDGKARAGRAVAGDGKAQAGDAVAGDGEARAGDVVAGGEAKERRNEAGPGRVVLKVGGRPGTRFAGTCVVGDDEHEVSGRVPERFVYEPGDRKVGCEIRNAGPNAGQLKFSITADGNDRKQKVRVTGNTMSFSFSGDTISYASSSSSVSKSSLNQKTKITSSSNFSVSSSSGSR